MKFSKHILEITREPINNKGGFKYVYLWNGEEIDAFAFKSDFKALVKHNNKRFYEEVYKKYNGDYLKQYRDGIYFLMDYKEILRELKYDGVIYAIKSDAQFLIDSDLIYAEDVDVNIC